MKPKQLSRIVFLISGMLFLFSSASFASQEFEPNNNSAQATSVDPSEPIYGKLEDTMDVYKVQLRNAGRTTVTLSGYPKGANLQLGVKGFQNSLEKVVDWQENRGEPSVSVTFDASRDVGYIWVSIQFSDSVCGYDWCIAQLESGGPYYTTVKSRSVPAVYNGQQVRGFAGYTVNIESGGFNQMQSNQPTAYVPGVVEKEPNDTIQQANVVSNATAVRGALESARDYFALSLPTTGPVTVTLSEYPEGTSLQLGASGFGRSREEAIGWAESFGRNSTSYTFDSTSTEGYVWISVEFYDTVCGFDWCLGQLKADGPYYALTSSPRMPKRYKGKTVEKAPGYLLSIKAENAVTQTGQPQEESQPQQPKSEQEVIMDLFQIMIDQGAKQK